MKSDRQPTICFGVFDHLDDADGSLRQQYTERLQIAAACDLAGFRAYHVAEHHGTPHGRAGSPNLFLSAVAQRTKRLRAVGDAAESVPSLASIRGDLYARPTQRRQT